MYILPRHGKNSNTHNKIQQFNERNGYFYEKIGNQEWKQHDLILKGVNGKDGIDGKRGTQISTLQGTTTLPSAYNFMLGDLLLVLQTSNLYQVTGTEDNRSWSNIGNLKGFSIWQSSA